MYRFIQKHGKKIMAVLGAVLMITFALPSTRLGGGGGSNVVGKLDGTKLLAPDYRRATNAWELMARTPFITRDMQRTDRSVLQVLLPPAALAQCREHPLEFLLLQEEAKRMGIGVSGDQLNSWVANVLSFKTGDADRDDDLKAALAQVLLVSQAYARAASALKVSSPLIDYHLAEARQSITLTAADFTTAQYTQKVPAVSEQQLQAQFTKYSDTVRGTISTNNPFGFGYKYPDRVKLQYITISRPAVRRFVEQNVAPGKPKDHYEWEVEAQKYYRQHLSEFATTQPVTRPSTAPAAQAASATTKPFADVRQQLIDRLIDEETDRKMAQIQDRIASMLASDWTAYHAAAATTMPATLPATSLGPPYNTVEYLQKLAMQIQSVYGVLPSVQSIADRFLTADDLARLPGIGQATREHPVQPLPMPLYIMTFTAPFVPEANRNHPDVLAEFEPTRVMHDAARNVYIARVSAAQVSHKPATLAEVEDQVRTDVIAKAAYDLARADASALLEKAKQSGLKSAAAGKSLLAIGPLTREPGASIPGLPISAASINMFLDKAFKLVTTPTSKPSGKPMELLELQHEGHVLVAELTDVQAMWNERTRSMEESQVADEVQRQFAQRFSQEWFNYNAVESRLKFVPAEGFSSREAPARPPEPAPPIF